MAFAGAIIGMPFSLEGFAFFAEAIFLGIYLYGWERVSPRVHLASGALVAASGAASAFFVTLANAWMNLAVRVRGGGRHPRPRCGRSRRCSRRGGRTRWCTCSSPRYVATGFAVAGIHAFFLLRDRASAFHRAALGIALAVGGAAALLQPLSGDLSARQVAATQPVKLAALEGQFETERGAPLRVGGLPDAERRETRFALEIPYGLSLLAFHDPRRGGEGARGVPPRGLAQHPARPPRLPGDGRPRDAARRDLRAPLRVRGAPARAAAPPPARRGPRRARRVRRARGRLARHRVGPPAVHRVGRAHHRRLGDPRRGPPRPARRLHAPLRAARRHDRGAPVAADREPRARRRGGARPGGAA